MDVALLPPIPTVRLTSSNHKERENIYLIFSPRVGSSGKINETSDLTIKNIEY